MTTKTNRKGFTIIEVVLVLAIAGLIFLMVFLGFPALQNSQKDTQRRNDYSQLFSQVTSYVSTLNGRIPSTGANLDPQKFMNKTGENPDGIDYKIQVYRTFEELGTQTPGVNADKTEDTVFVVFHATCDGDTPIESKNKKDFVVYGFLATGTGQYCQTNNTDVVDDED